MSVKLKPCPFCGGKVELDFVDEEFYIVRCDKCASATSFATELEDGTAEDSTKEETISAWNRRITMSKCENCYHYETCLNSLSGYKVLNNTCREEAERALEERGENG